MRPPRTVFRALACLLVATPALAQPTASPSASAPKESPLESGPQPVQGKWGTVLYGFVELDAIHDSTQSFNEPAGNGAVARPGTYAGEHARTMFGIRNSRLGFKLTAPTVEQIAASAVLEMDFLGNQPPVTEAAYFQNPTFRVRHFALKLETPVVDALLGQYWALFGWQGVFHPNTVQIQGIPGEVYARVPQARISRTLRSGDVAVDIAVAAARPPQRNSAVPDGQGGVKLSYGGWKTVRTAGATGTAADALAVGVSGVVRRFIVPWFEAQPTNRRGKTGYGISLDAFVPVIPAALERRNHALALTGSFAAGTGIADLYSGLTGGVTFPALPNPDAVLPAPTYAAEIDNGLVTFDAQGRLHTINWQSFIVGLQYYLPIDGRLWVTANYSRMHSTNALRYTDAAGAAKVFDRSWFWDANLFFDLTPAVRFGAEYAAFHQTYGDSQRARNDRLQFSSFFIF